MSLKNKLEKQIEHNPNQDPLTFRFFNEIGIIHQLITANSEKMFPMGLKKNQFFILNHLVRLGDGRAFQKITDAFQVTKGAMTNNLKRLQQKKLIIIKNDSNDGRSKRVYLTKLGRKIREQGIKSIESSFSEIEKEFSQKQFKDALPFLIQTRKYLDEKRNT